MARYNSVNTTGSVAGGNQITTPSSGLLTTLTGTGTVTVPNPVLYTGQSQTFYNASGVTLTLGTPSGNFTGPGTSGSTTQLLANGAIITIVSDGTNYIAQDWLGGSVVATSVASTGAVTFNPSNASVSLQPTGTGTVTILPATVGTIDNMNIGATTKGTGAFTSLTANGAVTLTSVGAASAYNTSGASLLVSGGTGIAGALYVNSPSYFSAAGGIGTGTTTANSAYPLTLQRFVGSSGNLILQGDDTVVGSPVINFTNTRTSTSGTINFDGTTFTVRTGTVSTPRGGSNTKVFFVNAGAGVGSNYIEIQAPATSSSDILFSSSSTNGYGIVRYDNATNSLQLWANSTQVVTVGSSGLGVGLGATLPSYPLHIAGKAWINNSSGDSSTRSQGLTVSINPGGNYSPGTDPGDVLRAMSIVAGTNATYPSILGFRNIQAGTAQQMVDLVLDPNTNKFYISRPGVTPWLSFSNTTHDMNTNRGFRNWTRSNSAVNTSAGSGSPTSMNVTQVGDNMYEYGFYFFSNTGGYPSCPNSYWVVCPVQKQNTGTLAWAEVEIRGVHRGMWGANGYEEYAKIVVGTGSDGGGIWVKEWLNGDANNSSNRIRVGYMDYNGTYTEGTNYNTGFNLGSYNANTIGQSYYKMPLFLKIYTNCGADKEYYITVRTTNPDALGPPFNGPVWLNPNTNPTSSIYW